MAGLTLTEAKKRMAVIRKKYLVKAKTPKELKLAEDNELFDYLSRNYVYQYNINRGNIDKITKDDNYYDQMAIILDKFNYDIVCEIYKEHLKYDPKAKEPKKLLDMARMLRRRYGRS